MAQATADTIRDLPKGDALVTAQLAGIMAAKRTAELIPLCHPLPLTHLEVRLAVSSGAVEVEATAETTAQTGVEMEALVAAARRRPDRVRHGEGHRQDDGGRKRATGREDEGGDLKAAVLTVSDGVHAGERDDASGVLLEELLQEEGFDVVRRVVPDEPESISSAIAELADGLVARADNRRHGLRPSRRDPRGDADRVGQARSRHRRGNSRRCAHPHSACASVTGSRRASRRDVDREPAGLAGGCRDGFAVLRPALRHGLELAAGDRETPHRQT